MSEQNTFTTVEWEADEFGAPCRVRINGQPVSGVQSVVLKQSLEDFNEVVITLKAVIAHVKQKAPRVT